MMKKLVSLLFGLFLVVCLIDGVLDIGLGIAGELKGRMAGGADDNATATRLARIEGLPKRYIPGLGHVILPAAVPGVTIGPEGERLHRHLVAPEDARHRILLLGASQAFGFSNDDDETLAAALERQLPGTLVRNFSMPGHTIPANVMMLDARLAAGEEYDRVIVVNGAVDLVRVCVLAGRLPPPAATRPVIAEIARQLTSAGGRHPADGQRQDPCATADGRETAATRVLEDLRGLLDYAQRRNVRVTFVLPPAPFGTPAEAEVVRDPAAVGAYATALGPALTAFRQKLAAAGLPDVLDLSEAFPSDGRGLFSDVYGHLSDAGNQLLARRIAEDLNRQLPPAPRPD